MIVKGRCDDGGILVESCKVQVSLDRRPSSWYTQSYVRALLRFIDVYSKNGRGPKVYIRHTSPRRYL